MKLWIVGFLISVLCFVAMATDEAFADKQQNFISLEKANEIFSKDADIRLITEKWAGYGCRTISHSSSNPYYTFQLKQDYCGNNSIYPVCEQYTILMDAYTGKILYPEEMSVKISAAKKTNEQVELEKTFKGKFEKIPEEIKRSCWTNEETCQQAIQNAVPLTLEALNKADPDIRSQGLRILCQLALPDKPASYKSKEAIPRVIELLRDEDYGIRYLATQTLAEIGDKKDENLIKSLLPLIHDTDSLVCRGAIRTLSKLGDASLVPTFISLLEKSEVTQEVVVGLGRFGDARAIDPLIKLFNNKKFFYIEKDIIAVLGDIGSKQAIPFLVTLLNKNYTRDTESDGSFNPHVPYMGADVCRALVRIGKDAVPYLLQSLKSVDWMERLYAAYALGLQKDATTLNALQEAEEKEKDITVKSYLAQAIAVINGKEYVSTLLQQLKIQVISAKDRYNPGETIQASIIVQNTGTAVPIIINIAEISFIDLAFEIIGPDGQPAPYIGPEYFKPSMPSEKTLLTLRPGKIHRFGPLILNTHFAFDKSGKYQVVGVYSNPPYASGIEFGVYALVGVVKTQPVMIEVR